MKRSALKLSLYFVKDFFVNKRFMRPTNHPFFLPLYKHPSISAICQDVFYGTAVSVSRSILIVANQSIGSGILNWCWQFLFIQITNDTCYTRTARCKIKNLFHGHSGDRIRNQLIMIVFGFFVAKWCSWPNKCSTFCFHFQGDLLFSFQVNGYLFIV